MKYLYLFLNAAKRLQTRGYAMLPIHRSRFPTEVWVLPIKVLDLLLAEASQLSVKLFLPAAIALLVATLHPEDKADADKECCASRR
jgi:hypothetical protein